MAEIDHSLIHEARKFITAANAHRVKTWIFCYETVAPDLPHRKIYEQLLREFVARKRVLLGMRVAEEVARDRRMKLRQASAALEEEVKRKL
jgi:hypothetical protein